MTVLRNRTEFAQTARWGEPAGSFAEVQPGETVEVPAEFKDDLLNQLTEDGEHMWELAEGEEATTPAPSTEEAPAADAVTGSEGAEETGSEGEETPPTQPEEDEDEGEEDEEESEA